MTRTEGGHLTLAEQPSRAARRSGRSGGMVAATVLLVASLIAGASLPAQVTPNCSSCAVWNTPQSPFRIYGNTYFVGTRGLTALLITSDSGHVLVDGGLSESAPLIAASIRALDFRLEDIRAIVNSHAHHDHAGGLAELQRLTRSEVFASPHSVPVLERGTVGRDDPQYAVAVSIAPVARVRPIPAGDSLADFAVGFAALEQVRCDILLTPHPDASAMWDRLAKREAGAVDAMRDTTACRRYAETARRALDQRVNAERAKMP